MLICNLLGGGNRSCAKNDKIFVFSAKNRNFADALSEKSEGPIKRTFKKTFVYSCLYGIKMDFSEADFATKLEKLNTK